MSERRLNSKPDFRLLKANADEEQQLMSGFGIRSIPTRMLFETGCPTAQTAGQLKSVYQEIGRTVGYDVHRRDITAWFTGLGLAMAILVDASLVRGVLVPAFMRLAGDANWWAPAPLRRLYLRIGLSETEPDSDVPEAPVQPDLVDAT